MKHRKIGDFALVLSVMMTLTICASAYYLVKKNRAELSTLLSLTERIKNKNIQFEEQIKLPYLVRQHPIYFPVLMHINKDVSGPAIPSRTPALVFVYGEHSCNVCVDESLRLCRELVGEEWLIGIGCTDNERSASRFVRLNHIRFPFYHDTGDVFLQANNIPAVPAFLLINQEGVIVDAMFPASGQEDVTSKFFVFANDYLSSFLSNQSE